MNLSLIDDSVNYLNNLTQHPYVLIVLFFLILIIIIYYIFFNNLGANSYTNSSFDYLSSLIWFIFLIVIFINALVYFFNINIFTEIRDIIFMLFNDIKNLPNNITNPENNNDIPGIDISGQDISPQNISGQDISGQDISGQNISDGESNDINKYKKEVYHLPGQRFTYNDAKAVCKSFNSTLADHKQLSDAQKAGASWCSYGWSKDKLALYPTTQTEFDELQKREGHEYDCGLPGINGGYISNPYIKMGANCYGYKPKKSDLEKQYLDESSRFPKTEKELLFDDRVNYWKKRLGNILISPFNNEKWYKLD